MPHSTRLDCRLPWLAAASLLAACGPAAPATDAIEVTATVPAIELRVAFPTEADFGDLPALMALELLAGEGYVVRTTHYAEAEFAVAALASGEADVGHGANSTHWAAVGQGAQIVTVMEQAANGWQIYAVLDIQTCAGLDGRRFAISGEGSVSAAMSDVYIQENCPEIERQIVLIQGSSNRAAALLAGEIDATPLELADVVELSFRSPGQFHTLTSLAQDLPGLTTTGVHFNREFAEANPQAVQDYLRALLTVHRQINLDHEQIASEAARRLDFDPEILQAIVEAYFAINAWDPNGGLTQDAVDYTVAFFAESGELDPGLTAGDVADLSYLDEVLAEMGRQ